jgi:hypothetical protein
VRAGTESNAGRAAEARAALRRCCPDVTDFVLTEVRPKYQDAGVPCCSSRPAARRTRDGGESEDSDCISRID